MPGTWDRDQIFIFFYITDLISQWTKESGAKVGSHLGKTRSTAEFKSQAVLWYWDRIVTFQSLPCFAICIQHLLCAKNFLGQHDGYIRQLDIVHARSSQFWRGWYASNCIQSMWEAVFRVFQKCSGNIEEKAINYARRFGQVVTGDITFSVGL